MTGLPEIRQATADAGMMDAPVVRSRASDDAEGGSGTAPLRPVVGTEAFGALDLHHPPGMHLDRHLPEADVAQDAQDLAFRRGRHEIGERWEVVVGHGAG